MRIDSYDIEASLGTPPSIPSDLVLGQESFESIYDYLASSGLHVRHDVESAPDLRP